ncbi:MAG: serine hydrolase, partial [Lysobacteraceae bacterium]
GAVILWNSESAAPSGLMPTIIDRALGLPAQDWIGLDKLSAQPATPRHHGKSSRKPGKSKPAKKSGRKHRGH